MDQIVQRDFIYLAEYLKLLLIFKFHSDFNILVADGSLVDRLLL